jgi:aspartate/glutamate racemase
MAKKIKRSKIFKKTLRQGFWKKQPKKKMVHKVVAYQQQDKIISQILSDGLLELKTIKKTSGPGTERLYIKNP